jgi:hypothetical protein
MVSITRLPDNTLQLDGSGLILQDARGRNLVLRADEQVLGVRALGDGAGYSLIVQRGDGARASWSELVFDGSGRQQGRAERLSELDFVRSELLFGVDLNGDGAVGLVASASRLDRGTGELAVFELVGQGLGIMPEADAAQAVPLLDARGNLWQSPSGQQVVAIRQDGDGFSIIVEIDRRGDVSHAELEVSAEGVVARRATNLSPLEVVALEDVYGVDIDGDGDVGLAAFGPRLDRGTGGVEIRENSGGGLGILSEGARRSRRCATQVEISGSRPPTSRCSPSVPMATGTGS